MASLRKISIYSASVALFLCSSTVYCAEQTASNPAAELDVLRDAVSATRAEEGAYSETLVNELSALLATGTYAEAAAVIDEQIHITKVNDGLYTDDLIPALLQQLELAAAQSDWEALFDRLKHLNWLFQRTDFAGIDTRIAQIKTTRDWLRLLLIRGPSSLEPQYLLELQALEEEALLLAQQGGATAEQITPLIYDEALAELYIALGIAATGDTSRALIEHQEGGLTATIRSSRIQSMTTAYDIERVYGARSTTAIDRVHRSTMSKHFELIESIGKELRIDPDNLPEDASPETIETAAMIKLYQGDSLLLRDQYELRLGTRAGPDRGSSNIGSAGRYYREAWNLFRQAGFEDDYLNSYFACPSRLPLPAFLFALPENQEDCTIEENGVVELPTMALKHDGIPSLSFRDLPTSELMGTAAGTRARLKFTLGLNGQARRLDAISSEPDTVSARIRGHEALESLQFRPALRDGEPLRLDHVEITIYSIDR